MDGMMGERMDEKLCRFRVYIYPPHDWGPPRLFETNSTVRVWWLRVTNSIVEVLDRQKGVFMNMHGGVTNIKVPPRRQKRWMG